MRDTGLYDQERFNEDGYFTNAQVGLRRYPAPDLQRVGQPCPLVGRAPTRATKKPTVQKYRRRRKSAGYVFPLLVILVSLCGLAYVGYHEYLVTDQGTAAATAAVQVVPPTASATTALLVHTDGSGATTGFTVASLHSDGGSRVVFIPSGLMVEIPGYGLDTLVNAGRFGGVDLSRLAVANLLTVEFDHVLELTPAALSELTRSFDPLLVDNPGRVDEMSIDSRIEVIYPAGAMLLASADTADFLDRRSLDESELDRLVRHQEFWTAYLLARADVVGEDTDVAGNIDAYLDVLASRRQSTEYRILDVQLIGGADEIYGVDRDALPSVIAEIDPSRDALVDPTAVQLLNGVGVPGLAAPIAERLVAVGASVQLTDNASRFDHEITQIVYYREEAYDAAVRIQAGLGLGEVVKAIEPIDVVDVTVVVGADLAAAVGSGDIGVSPLDGSTGSGVQTSNIDDSGQFGRDIGQNGEGR